MLSRYLRQRFSLLRPVITEGVEYLGPAAIVDLSELVEIAVGFDAQVKELVPLVLLYDLGLQRILNEIEPLVKE